MTRTGDWGCTVSGRQFWPGSPRPDDVELEDIAHALSMQCRFGGHCREFYSVAQHSVLVSNICEPEYALWGLLHDASEAYLVDVPRPVKQDPRMAGYLEIEAAFMQAICQRFGLTGPMPPQVKIADEYALWLEARTLMPPASVKTWTFNILPPAYLETVEVVPWSFEKSRMEFRHRFHQLKGEYQLLLNRTGSVAANIRDL